MADGIRGINAANVTQFQLNPADGKAYAGAGDVTIDASGVTLLEGDSSTNQIRWKESGGQEIGAVYCEWGGGAGDETVTWLTSYENLDAAGAIVILKAQAEGEAEVRFHVNSDGTIHGTACTDFILASGAVNWLDFTYGGNYILRFEDYAGANKFQLINDADVTVFEVASSGAGGGAKFNTDLRVGGGLYVGSLGTDPPDDNIWCDGDIRIVGGLYVGQLGVDPPNDNIVCDGTITAGTAIIAGTTITTNAGSTWDLGNTAAGTIVPDTKVHIKVDGSWFTFHAQAGLV